MFGLLLVAGIASAQEPARERPLYEKARGLFARAATERAAQGELERLADQLVEEGYGLGDPLTTDKVLASSVALASFAPVPRHGDALLDLLRQLDELLREGHARDPDLWLAFAHGMVAVQAAPSWGGIEPEERRGLVLLALQGTEGIAPEDGRDAYGVHLSEAAHREFSAAGLAAEATELLERGLLRFREEHERRPLLLCLAANERSRQNRYGAAWRLVLQAEDALERVNGTKDLAAILERTLASVRCQLELACGLPDEAWKSLDRESAAVDAGADDPESRLSLLLDLSAVGFLQDVPSALGPILERLDAELEDPREFPGGPAARAQIRARRALLQHLHERMGGAAGRALPMLLEALADEALDGLHRAVVVLRLVDLEVQAGRLEEARRHLHRLEGDQAWVEALPEEVRLGVVARRARLALLTAADEGELVKRRAEVADAFDAFVDTWEEAPVRAGGLGLLVGRNRRLLLDVAIELAERLDGEVGVERALDRVLQLQWVGSLARSLRAAPATLAGARSLLGDEAGMLVFVRGYVAVHVFWLDADALGHRVLPMGPGSAARLRTLRNELANSPQGLSDSARAESGARIEQLAREVAEQFVPAEARSEIARWKHLYVVGEDVFGGVPFDCLPIEGKAIGLTHDLASLPSLPVGLALAHRSRESAAGEGFLTVVATDPGAPGLPDIPAGRAELVRLGATEQDLVAAEARWPRLLERLVETTPAALHVLAHGLRDLEREVPVGLALAGVGGNDGSVWVEDILATDARFPALVVLSACGAARGPRRIGDDGLAQLAGAFFVRGSACVVHASNDLALEPTLRLVADLRRELDGGASPSEALRMARTRLRGEAAYDHPFYLYSLRASGLGLGPAVERRSR